MFAYKDFPVQPEPLYDFFLDDNGTIQRRTLTRYKVVPFKRYGHTPLAYRIHTGTSIIIKEFDKLDLVYNNHILSKTDDPQQALQTFLQHHQTMINNAMATITRHQEILNKVLIANAINLSDTEEP